MKESCSAEGGQEAERTERTEATHSSQGHAPETQSLIIPTSVSDTIKASFPVVPTVLRPCLVMGARGRRSQCKAEGAARCLHLMAVSRGASGQGPALYPGATLRPYTDPGYTGLAGTQEEPQIL